MNVSASTHEIGGIEFVRQNGGLYIPYVTLYCFGVVIGVSGNTLIMGSIICTKELHTVMNMFIFNLSISDLIISGFVDFFSVVAVFAGKSFFRDKRQLCDFIAAVCLVACATSMINICFLAFNRFLNIIYHNQYKKVFTRRNTFLFCLIPWMFGILVDLPNILGWGGHHYDNGTLTCIWNRHADHSYSIFFPMTTIVIPSCLTLYWYIRIFLFAYNSKRRILPQGDKASFFEINRSLHITKGLFGSFFLFVLCWVPYGIVVMTDWAGTHPIAAELYTVVLAHLNSALNPIFYGISNPAFRNGYKNFLRILMRKPEKSVILVSSKAQKDTQQTFTANEKF